MSTAVPVQILRPRAPKPEWLKVRAPGSPSYVRLKGLMREQGLHTVCEEAHCPNIGECWHHGTATFMILGDVCTRACGFCAVQHGKPAGLDRERTGPGRRARSHDGPALRGHHVGRPGRPRGRRRRPSSPRPSGSSASASPSCRIEVLIPDFQGHEAPLRTVLDAGPDVLNHNTETVPRLYRMARPGGRYPADARTARAAPAPTPRRIATKSGHHGRPRRGVARGRRRRWPICTAAGVGILTIGQYLSPSASHLPVARYYHPDEFEMLRVTAVNMGFGHVECGPLVRSSYHAHEQTSAYEEAGRASCATPATA